MKKILFTCLTFFSALHLIAQTSYQKGVIRGTNADNTSITRMEFDDYDYHVIFGKFHDSVKVEPFGQSYPLYGGSAAVHNAFFSVYDPSGSLYFGHKLGNATDSVTIKAATFDMSGNVYVAGSFKGTVDFADNAGSPYFLTSTGNDPDAFIASYDYLGNFMNAIVLECDSTRASVNAIDINANGELVVVGNFIGTIDVDGSASNMDYTSTGIDGFVAIYGFGISLLSSSKIEGPGNQYPTHVVTDWTDIIIGGTNDGQIDFDLSGSANLALTNGGKDVFMMYLDGSYNTYNYISLGGAGDDKLKDFYFNYNQGFYVLMDFEQTVNFDPQFGTFNMTSSGQSDVAVVRYFNNFQLGYAKKFGNSNADFGSRIMKNISGGGRENRGGPPPPNPEDDYIFTMSFSGSVDFNPDAAATAISTSSNTPVNSAVVNLDSSGAYLFHGVTQAESISGYKGTGFAGNDMIMAGNFSGTNVDLLVYDDTSSVSHSGVKSGYYLHYNRCQFQAEKPFIVEPFECGTCSAKLAIDSVSGGVAPYYFMWSNGDYYSYDSIATQVCQDNSNYYDVTIEDYYGCVWNDTIWVIGHDTAAQMDISLNLVSTSCGNNFGSATATPSNTLGSASYYWSTGETASTADSLLAGNYFVQVTDDSVQCYIHKTFFIDNSDGPQITVNSSVEPACGAIDDGSIDVTVTGGASPYTFHWTNGATTEDISGLSGGTYTLNVTDAAGCENMVCVTLYQPGEIQAFNYYTNASCFNTDGTLIVEAYGSYAPYTFQWDAAAGNSTNDTVSNLASGIYSVMVTDSLGCSKSFNFGLSDWNGPWAWINWTSNPNCLGGSGYIDAYSYDANFSGSLTYLWAETTETTEDIAVTDGGIYNLLVTDGFGCKAVTTTWIYESLPMAPTICMVTVDSTATQNVVVWDKSTTQEADYYNVYREGFCNSNDFGIVGSVDFDSLSVFYDTVVNSDTRTWRYYVTAVDTCGNESDPSDIHRTIHLTAAVDADTNVVLNWSDYQGMQILGYKIYRRQPSGTLFDYVDSVDALQTQYLDTIDFTGYTEVEYFVDAVPAMVCNATRAYNQNEARSNHSRAGVPQPDTSTIQTPEINQETSFSLFPNPSGDLVNLVISGSMQSWKMEMTDQTGRIVLSGTLRERAGFATKEIPAGVYFIRLTSDKNESHTLKLMVIH